MGSEDSASSTAADTTASTGQAESTTTAADDTTSSEGGDSSSTGEAGVVLFEDSFDRADSATVGNSEYPGEEWSESGFNGGSLSIVGNALAGGANQGNALGGHDEEIDCATLRLRAIVSLGSIATESIEQLFIKYDQNGALTGGGYGIDINVGMDDDYIGIRGGHIGLPPPGPLGQTAASAVLSPNTDYFLELTTTGEDGLLTVAKAATTAIRSPR